MNHPYFQISLERVIIQRKKDCELGWILKMEERDSGKQLIKEVFYTVKDAVSVIRQLVEPFSEKG